LFDDVGAGVSPGLGARVGTPALVRGKGLEWREPCGVTLGQSIEEVTASLGAPLTVIDLGSKKIYKYRDMKVIFKDGKVSDVG